MLRRRRSELSPGRVSPFRGSRLCAQHGDVATGKFILIPILSADASSARAIPFGAALADTDASFQLTTRYIQWPASHEPQDDHDHRTRCDQEALTRGTSVHRSTLAGRLVADPQLRTTASGISVTTVRLATNDRDQVEFHDVVLWRQLADFAAKYMTKGRLAYVEGRVQTRTWEATDGSKRRAVEIVADRFQALSAPRPAESAA
jgi:single-strand DNA-binding protein